MANINQINEMAQSTGTQTQAKPKAGERSTGFDSLLSSALEKTDASEGDTKAMGLGEISSPGFELEAPSSIVTGKTDKLIGMLDNYVSQLENPQVSLKHIEPVLEEINADATALLEETRFLGDEDSQLKNIATQTVVAAKTEYLKFQRGDYLS
ncbi:MAG: hypothetical protein HUK40_16115 [Desulfobacter sp.]|nr:hypothetical protein [Desulfobacter sp.]WDP87105.1 MAG: hypothetical protein HUN05_19870 [Desulfobacter sp.]